MKTKPFGLMFSMALGIATCPATNVGLSTIEQPVNLGAESDPGRIPLGAVATESNYHYGRGPVITSPRPSLHGAMEWKSGIEINQNLASSFGIEVDNHDLPHSPATIRLRDFAIPAYSPHTREQVLAATVHCLLRSNSGRPKSPITLKITADSPADAPLVKKYSGDYVNAPDNEDGPPIEPTQVPGTRLETDARGVTWVVFPDVKSTGKKPARPPVTIAFRLGSEAGPDDPLWQLLPVWAGTDYTWEQSIEIIGRPYPLFYDCINPSSGGGPETNALFSGKPAASISRFDITTTETTIYAKISDPDASTENLAASILALVVSTQPTRDHLLSVTLETSSDEPPPWFERFKVCPEWKTGAAPAALGPAPVDKRLALTCSFAWDPQQATLTQGAVPLVRIVRPANGGLFIEASGPPDNEKPAEDADPSPEMPEKADTDPDPPAQ
jgi:hypothetical protein